jgi:hypothetical protein
VERTPASEGEITFNFITLERKWFDDRISKDKGLQGALF